MCGIAGFVDFEAGAGASYESAVTLQAMCDSIRHRGPDDEGMFLGAGVAIGMRRLSIIDLATGRQPMANEDGTLHVVFNGEIYNYADLRRDLERCGHRFRSASDTETIVHAYEEWGSGAFRRLRGMFAIALWDDRDRTLVLARDHAGIKPLFYVQTRERLIFGSEIKALLVTGQVDPQLDLAAFDHYLSFLYTPGDRSIFRGVRKLPPGHLLRMSGGRVAVEAYWTLSSTDTFTGSEDDAAELLHETLGDAVRAHMVSDVPIGAFLSGGIDSSLVVARMAECSSRPVRTFSIGFDEPRFDEIADARRTAALFGTDHHEFVVRPDAVAIVDRLVRHFDEPFGDVSAVPTWYVSEMASRHVTVVLSGDGGDELFGGYDRYLPHARVEAFDRWTGPVGRHVAGAVWPWVPHGRTGRNFLRHVSQDAPGRYLDGVAFFRPDERAALVSADVGACLAAVRAETAMRARFARHASLDWASQMMRVDFETYLPEDILTKVDRMSMAHGLESRVPLLDPHVVRVATMLPAHMKIHGRERKRILKRVAARVLPDEVLSRPKRGFAVPVGEWFRGPLRDMCHDLLQSPRARQRGYFNRAAVDRLIAEHESGRREHPLRLWQLLVFELWQRRYLDGVPVASAAAVPQAPTFRPEASGVP